MMLALAGGVGGARMALGLAQVLSPRELAIVVNTGDDFEHLGLTICPDLDTVLYTLAGLNNTATGWGRAEETWHALHTIERLGGETWFKLGDRDLGLHLVRGALLRDGAPLSRVTATIARRLGIRHTILPMSDDPVRTRVRTASGELAFQDYFVREQCRPRVQGFRFAGAARAGVPPLLARALTSRSLQAVIVCPSNPYVSIEPILAVPAIRRALKACREPVIAVSPIVGGRTIKGPAAKMMRELGASASVLGVVRHYGPRVDGWVIDRADSAAASKIERMGKGVLVTDTIMRDRTASARLAREVVRFARILAGMYARAA
jgi:LPPG:FO 2-phospho-L-lactate transferase